MSKPEMNKVVSSKNGQPGEVSENARLQLHNLVLQQQLCREQLNGLILQFLQSPQARILQDKIDELTRQANAATQQLFLDMQVDPSLYQLNIETGTFVPKSND